MDTADSKSSQPSGSTAKGAAASADAQRISEFLWQPYRLMSHALLQTQQNLTAFTAVNRNLADEMQAIMRRSQDIALQLSEKSMRRASAPSHAVMSVGEIDEMYNFAISGLRELGDAAVAAQIRSIEALRAHAMTTMTKASEAMQGKPKA